MSSHSDPYLTSESGEPEALGEPVSALPHLP